jgi:hypothetical protein
MTPRLLRIDRAVTFLAGLALTALGLLLIDWQYHWAFRDYPTTFSTDPADEVVTADWFPWALAVVGIILGLLGLLWLLAHLRRRGPSTLRLSASDETGRVQADLRSIADAAAVRLGNLAPVTGVKGTPLTVGSHPVIVLRGCVDPAAAPAAITDAADVCTQDVAAAFPDHEVTCRILLDAPQRSRFRRDTRVRVR